MTGGAAIIACSRDAGAAVRGLSVDQGPSASNFPPRRQPNLGGGAVFGWVDLTQRRVDVFGDAAGSRTIGIDACLHVSCITTLLGDP